MLSMCRIMTNTQGGGGSWSIIPSPMTLDVLQRINRQNDKIIYMSRCEIARTVFACVYTFWERSAMGKIKYFPLRHVQNGLSAPKTGYFIVFKFSQAAHLLRKIWYFRAMVAFIGDDVRVSNSLHGTRSESHRSEPPTHTLFGLITQSFFTDSKERQRRRQ